MNPWVHTKNKQEGRKERERNERREGGRKAGRQEVNLFLTGNSS